MSTPTPGWKKMNMMKKKKLHQKETNVEMYSQAMSMVLVRRKLMVEKLGKF